MQIMKKVHPQSGTHLKSMIRASPDLSFHRLFSPIWIAFPRYSKLRVQFLSFQIGFPSSHFVCFHEYPTMECPPKFAERDRIFLSFQIQITFVLAIQVLTAVSFLDLTVNWFTVITIYDCFISMDPVGNKSWRFLPSILDSDVTIINCILFWNLNKFIHSCQWNLCLNNMKSLQVPGPRIVFYPGQRPKCG